MAYRASPCPAEDVELPHALHNLWRSLLFGLVGARHHARIASGLRLSRNGRRGPQPDNQPKLY